jgi:hypothetical protein
MEMVRYEESVALKRSVLKIKEIDFAISIRLLIKII